MFAHALRISGIERVIPGACADRNNSLQDTVRDADPAQHAATCIIDPHNVTIGKITRRRVIRMHFDRFMPLDLVGLGIAAMVHLGMQLCRWLLANQMKRMRLCGASHPFQRRVPEGMPRAVFIAKGGHHLGK